MLILDAEDRKSGPPRSRAGSLRIAVPSNGGAEARIRFRRRALPQASATIQSERQAEVAQLVEQLIRNQQVAGSSPAFGSTSYCT